MLASYVITTTRHCHAPNDASHVTGYARVAFHHNEEASLVVTRPRTELVHAATTHADALSDAAASHARRASRELEDVVAEGVIWRHRVSCALADEYGRTTAAGGAAVAAPSGDGAGAAAAATGARFAAERGHGEGIDRSIDRSREKSLRPSLLCFVHRSEENRRHVSGDAHMAPYGTI